MSEEPHPPDVREQHASEGVFTRGVWLGIAGVAVVILISGVLGAWLVAWLQAERPVPTAQQRAQIEQRRWPGPPGPFDNLAELRRELEAGQRERLRSAGWINRERDLAHVPIEYAKQYIVENGLPDFESPAGSSEPSGPGSTSEEGADR